MTADVPDPLLRLPNEQIAVPTGLSGDERLEAVLIHALDHVNLHAMAWPAADGNGNLVPPPDAHVLHDSRTLMISPTRRTSWSIRVSARWEW